MSDIILHHYPPSPVTEKIRVAFGLKNLSWKSVEENRLPPRPELMAMTGGYRRIPVMQIGADIYCDTQCILKTLEERFPKPSFHPQGNSGASFGISRWTDLDFFNLGVRLAIAPMADALPKDFVEDRTRLYFGPDGDMAKEAKDLPHTLSQLRPQLGWLEDQLLSNGAYLHGIKPSMTDLLGWYVVWFIKGRYAQAEQVLAEFPSILAWAARMEAIGHGNFEDMTPAESLDIAFNSTPTTKELSDAADPQELKPGMKVSITTLGDTGETGIEGKVKALHRDTVAIARHHELCGDVVVHFPRVGYRVTPL